MYGRCRFTELFARHTQFHVVASGLLVRASGARGACVGHDRLREARVAQEAQRVGREGVGGRVGARYSSYGRILAAGARRALATRAGLEARVAHARRAVQC